MLLSVAICACAGALLSWLLWRYRNRKLLALSAQIPGPPTLPLLGNALLFMNKPNAVIEVIQSLRQQYGDVMQFWLGNDMNVVVSDPEDVRILLSSPKTSQKGVQYKYMTDIIGEGILSGSGPTWRLHRKIVTPNYSKRAVSSYAPFMHQEAQQLVKRLEKLTGKDICIYSEVVVATTYTVCQALMGLTRKETDDLPHLREVIFTTNEAYQVIFNRMTIWWMQFDPIFWLTDDYKVMKKLLEMIYRMCNRIICHRKKALSEMSEVNGKVFDTENDNADNTNLNIVDRLLLSNKLNNDELVQETFTLFTASQEATAKITSFFLLMMAYHPDCQEKLYQEIMTVVASEETVTDKHLKDMPYLDMAFREVLRLFPIGVMLQRTIMEDIAISNVTLPAGVSLTIPTFHIQRDPRFWDNPDSFDPERFSPEACKLRHPMSYVPFSLGPMDCLGRHFGIKLVKTLAVHVIRRFKLTSKESYKDLRICFAVSVTSKSGFGVDVTLRDTAI